MPKTFLYVKDFFSATMDFVVLNCADSGAKVWACRIGCARNAEGVARLGSDEVC